VNGLSKLDPVETPFKRIGQDNPLDSLMCSVIYGLAKVILAQAQGRSFDFNEHADLAVNAYSQITERSPNLLLACEFVVLLIAKNVREHVFDERDGIRFRDILSLRSEERRVGKECSACESLCFDR